MIRTMRSLHRFWSFLVTALAIQLAWSPLALAEERRQCPICAKAGRAESTYAENAGFTLMRGASNALLGWTDLMRQPAREVKQGRSVGEGLLNGVSSGVVRTFGGIGEVLTFWVPKVGKHYVHFSRDCPICAGQPQSDPARPPAPAR